MAYFLRGETAQAVAALEKAVEKGDRGYVHFLLLLAHAQLGHDKEMTACCTPMGDWLARTLLDPIVVEAALEAAAKGLEHDAKNAALLLFRSRMRSRAGKLAEARTDFAQSRTLDPKLPVKLMDLSLLSANADAQIVRGVLERVAEDQNEWVKRQPDETWYWYNTVVLQAYLGNKEEYRRLCRGMLERFGDTSDLIIAERLVKACSLLPGVVEEREALTKLADRIGAAPPPALTGWHYLTRGLADYRAGKYPEAAGWLEKSLMNPMPVHGTAAARYLLAMAQQRQNQGDAARATLAKAQETTRQIPGLEKSGGRWLDWLINDLLRREAEMLLEEKKSDPEK